VGNRIPDFTLKLADGSSLTSADLRQGRKPAFLFFSADW
jgi:peroxiredoxin